MVSKANISRFHEVSKIEYKQIEKPKPKLKTDLDKIKEELIPNKILDTMMLSSERDSKKPDSVQDNQEIENKKEIIDNNDVHDVKDPLLLEAARLSQNMLEKTVSQ